MCTTFAAAGLTVALAACGSSATRSVEPGPTTTAALASAGSALSFRRVLGSIPYGQSTTTSVGAAGAPASCDRGRRVTNPAQQAPARPVVLADRRKTACYALGPTLLTVRSVVSADAVSNPTTSEWVVNVDFGNDDFVQKVVSVATNEQVAIILNGVVESAPNINPGITGRDVTIDGGFDEATARGVAAEIDPSSASRTPETPTTTFLDAFDKRCTAVGPKLGFPPVSGTSLISVGSARAALERAHDAVPAVLTHADAEERLALCEFTKLDPGQVTTATTICPNGDRAEVGPAPVLVLYAVDASLKAVKLPGIQYVLPGAVPPDPGPCFGLGAP